MGDLILMSRPKVAARSVVVGETAAILFFTGIRYQRLDDSAAPPAPIVTKRRRPSRSKKSNLAELHA